MIDMSSKKINSRSEAENWLTIEEFKAIYDRKKGRYELIDGIVYPLYGSKPLKKGGAIYAMAAPKKEHQDIVFFLALELGNFFKGKKCKPYVAPFDVFLDESKRDENGKLLLNERSKGYAVQPDLMVICDKDKLKEDGCHGAPDFIIEILSHSTKEKDEDSKLIKYRASGVREYWIVDPKKQNIIAYKFNGEDKFNIYSFKDKVKSWIFEDLEIDFNELEI